MPIYILLFFPVLIFVLVASASITFFLPSVHATLPPDTYKTAENEKEQAMPLLIQRSFR